MSCLTLQPRLLTAQPLWWSRHIDFHTSCVICWFVKTHFGNVLSNLLIFNLHFFRTAELCSLPVVSLVKNAELWCDSVSRFLRIVELCYLPCSSLVQIVELGEFRPHHPGSWTDASESWFWSLAPKPCVSLTFSLAN